MKIKSGYILRSFINEWVLTPTFDKTADCTKMIKINESGKILLDYMKGNPECTSEDLADELVRQYENLDKAVALSDAEKFINELRSQNIIEDEK